MRKSTASLFLLLGTLGSGFAQTPGTASRQTGDREVTIPGVELRLKTLQMKSDGRQNRFEVRQDLDAVINELKASIKGIYGVDDRRNYFHVEVTDNQRRAADATLALVRPAQLSKDGTANTFSLPNGTAGLCTAAQLEELNKNSPVKYEVEPFSDEPAPAFCSGFKVADDIVVTAGHCIRSQSSCNNTRFIHGFRRNADDASFSHRNIPPERIFACKTVLKTVVENSGADYAIVRTDRPMTNVPTAVLRSSGQLAKGDGVTVVGYPLGLPVKVAGNATVRSIEDTFFVANLDTYHGNSGSAVFNSNALTSGNLLVEGILVRGDEDFEITTPCRVSKRCEDSGCTGESVTLASEARKNIP